MGAIANFAAGAAQAGAGLYGQQALEEQKAQVDLMKAQRITEINDQMAQATEARHMTQNVAMRQQTAQRFTTAIDNANNAALLDNYNKDNPDTPQTSVDSLAEEEKAAYRPNDVQIGRHLVRQLGMQGELSGKEIVAENRSESQNSASMAKTEAYDDRTDAMNSRWADADEAKADVKKEVAELKEQNTKFHLTKGALDFLTKRATGLQTDLNLIDPSSIKKNPELVSDINRKIDAITSQIAAITGVDLGAPKGAIGAGNKPAFDPSKFMGK